MKDKDKVVERLTGEEQPKEVLGIDKKGPDFSWVTLVLDGKTIRTDEGNLTWEVNSKFKKVMAHIKNNPEDDTTYRHGEFVRIVGNKKMIQNLLFNIGIALPTERRNLESAVVKEEPEVS
mgnify:CR=1 FL=1